MAHQNPDMAQQEAEFSFNSNDQQIGLQQVFDAARQSSGQASGQGGVVLNHELVTAPTTANQTEGNVSLLLIDGRLDVSIAIVEALKTHCKSCHLQQWTNENEIRIPGVTMVEMKLFLRFFLSQELIPEDFLQLCPLIALHDKLRCNGLKDKFMHQFATTREGVFHLLEAAERSRSIGFVESCIRMCYDVNTDHLTALESKLSNGTLYAMSKYCQKVKEIKNGIDYEDEEKEEYDFDCEIQLCSQCVSEVRFDCKRCCVIMSKRRHRKRRRECGLGQVNTDVLFK